MELGRLRNELGVLEMSWEPFDYRCGHSVQVRTHTGKTQHEIDDFSLCSFFCRNSVDHGSDDS